jgi:trk system potassium uptake protein TrkA
MQNQQGSAVAVHRMGGGQIEAIEFIAEKDTKHLGEKLKDIPTKENVLIVSILRGDRLEIPSGNSRMQEGDSVVVVTNSNVHINQLNDIFGD